MAARVMCRWLALLVFWFGCSDVTANQPQTPQAAQAGGEAPTDPCAASPMTSVPASVTDVVDHINRLPKPVSLPCLVASLPRPLQLHATRSVFSAQPAVGPRSPRIFLFYDGLILSIALAGMGKDLLEFGERRPDARSLKAEIEFPVAAELSHAAPFERIVYKEGQTSCAFCHAAESRDSAIDFAPAYVSTAYQPAQRQERVSVADLEAELQQCDAQTEPQRCAMLGSLFEQATPQERAFPADYATFQ